MKKNSSFTNFLHCPKVNFSIITRIITPIKTKNLFHKEKASSTNEIEELSPLWHRVFKIISARVFFRGKLSDRCTSTTPCMRWKPEANAWVGVSQRGAQASRQSRGERCRPRRGFFAQNNLAR